MMTGQAHRRQSGLTLIEVLFVILVIGILASIAAINYQPMINKARMQATQALLDSLSAALGDYYMDQKEYPPSGSDMLRRALLGLPPFVHGKTYAEIKDTYIAPEDWETRYANPAGYPKVGLFGGGGLIYDTSLFDAPPAWQQAKSDSSDTAIRPIIDAWQRPIVYVRGPVLQLLHRQEAGLDIDAYDQELRDEYEQFQMLAAWTDQPAIPKGSRNRNDARPAPFHRDSYQLISVGLDGWTRVKNSTPYGGTFPAGFGSLIWDNRKDDDGDNRVDLNEDNTGTAANEDNPAEDDLINAS